MKSNVMKDVLLAQHGVDVEVASWVPEGSTAPSQVHLIVHVRENPAAGLPRHDLVLRMKSREAVDAIRTLLGEYRDEVFGQEVHPT